MTPNRARTAVHLLVCLAVLGHGPLVAAQLASRPADEWVKVLDSPQRLESLKVDEVTAALGLRPGEVIADLGAGTGPFVASFARAVSQKGLVYAVELDRGFFPHIEAKAKAAGVGNVRTVLGEPGDPKLPGRDLDVAFFHDVLHHVEDRQGYLKNLTGYLKPTGRVAVIDYDPAQSPHRNEPSLQVGREQVAAWLAPLGYVPVQEHGTFTDKYFVVYARK